MPQTETGDPISPDTEQADEPRKRMRRIDRKRRRWLPRFRLMDLIWLSLIAATLMSWRRDHERLVAANERLVPGIPSAGHAWSINQILGAPDTPLPGDHSSAWASKTQDASREWVIVEFPKAVEVRQIVAYENYNPGTIDRICRVSFKNDETEIWKGLDPTPRGSAMGKSTFAIKPGVRSRRFKLYLDSPAVLGWNEIDAVALYGRDGSVQWVSNAWASSSFGDNRELPSWFWP